MKWTIVTIFLLTTITAKAQTADTIALKDVNANIGKLVTIKCQAADFDSRANALYLYIGNRYPDQPLSILVRKNADGKQIKIDKDIILGRKIVYFTGKIISYNEAPDSSALTNQPMLKREVEQPHAGVLEYTGQSVTFSHTYQPRNTPIDLKGKLVIIIDDKKQVGTKKYPGFMSANF